VNQSRSAPPATQPPQAAAIGAPPPAALEHLGIAPQRSGSLSPAAIDVDWESVLLGTNRSCACTVTADDGTAISVVVAQGMYRRTASGTGHVKVSAIPPGPVGTEGSITARHDATGEVVTYTWRWEHKVAITPPPAPVQRGFLSRLLSRHATAAAKRPPRIATLEERLGNRAALAVRLEFFGQQGHGQRFAFILDRSGSMSGARWIACCGQLERALKAMPTHAEFKVLLFNTGVAEPSGQAWTRAEPALVNEAIAWVGTHGPSGGTNPVPAFERVFSDLPPDVIYFLTDGDIEPFSAEMYAEVRGTAPTVVNTVALENDYSGEVLARISSESGGQFVMIPRAGAGRS
jgi:hypothetical protein